MKKILGNKEKIKKAVRNNYAKVASGQSSCSCSVECCTEANDYHMISKELGYTDSDLNNVPEGANMGLGCGNPNIFSALKENEIVLDLGSGGGLDSFLAANKVGLGGKVIGVDMTPEMVSKARMNAQKGNSDNVEFRLGEIEYLPIADSSIDVIISNCVINLSPDKPQVFKEAYRVLKSGGRLAISDIVKTADLPEEINSKMEVYTGCISGASTINNLQNILESIGFTNIKITPKDESKEFIKKWIPDSNIESYIQSATLRAIKP